MLVEVQRKVTDIDNLYILKINITKLLFWAKFWSLVGAYHEIEWKLYIC